jgi:hypothetical protein
LASTRKSKCVIESDNRHRRLRARQVTLREGSDPEAFADFIADGLRRGKAIDCFDYVPSNARMLYAALRGMRVRRFCEWGSGIGIGLGVAAMRGLEACGIEIHPELAEASRRLLADYRLPATVITGSYFDVPSAADIYFNYSWPSQWRSVEEHFLTVAPRNARLLICYGADDIRCKRIVESSSATRRKIK